jgi:CubicO group peptidase (beta-lactamase class C family)
MLSIRLDETQEHRGNNPVFGDKNDDTFFFDVPTSDGYDHAELEIVSQIRGGARITAEPASHGVGTLQITVHWWYDGGSPLQGSGRIKYRIKVFSTENPQLIVLFPPFVPSIMPLFTFARFKAVTNNYLHAVQGGGGAVDASGAQGDQGSRFVLVDHAGTTPWSGRQVNLLSASGHWVTAEHGGSSTVTANRVLPREWESFTLVDAAAPAGSGPLAHGAQVALRASDGTFLRTGAAPGSLSASGTTVTGSHTFTLELVPGFDYETPNTGLRPGWALDTFVDAVRAHVKAHQIPAATIAIVRNGQPQFLQGYGYLDPARTNLTLPSSIMLIASIDKHITSVALEIWMEQSAGAITKHTKFFPFLRSLGVQPDGGHVDDARVDTITFLHMIRGTSGLSQDRPASLVTPEQQASWVMAHGLVKEPGTHEEYPNLENELLRFAIFKHKGGRAGFLTFLKEQVGAPAGTRDIDLLADSEAALNPREPWYKGAGRTFPNRALLLTASAEALGRLFSRFRQNDGRPMGKDVPKINAIQITPQTGGGSAIRVNCGGSAYTSGGITWDADRGFTPDGSWPSSVTTAIANTTDIPLYQTDRAGSLIYRFDLPDGTYQVTLKFAETWSGHAGDRLFSLAINEETVMKDFDILAAATAVNRAVDRTFTITTEAGEGITISALPTGGQVWYGGFGGTTAMVEQMPWLGLVNVALFDAGESADEIAALLRTDVLVGSTWP